jgi:phage tail-like protein
VDANLQRPFLLASDEDWSGERDAVSWDAPRRLLRLRGARRPTWTETPAAAAARLATVPGAIDRYDTRARVVHAGAEWRVVATGAASDEVTIVTSSVEITDIAIGNDDILYVAAGANVIQHDLRGRWPDHAVAIAGGASWRLAPAAGGGVWVIAAPAAGAAIGRVRGQPVRPLAFEYAPTTFRPRPEEPDPPRFEAVAAAVVPATVTPAAIATSPAGRLALLALPAVGDAQLFLFDDNRWSAPLVLHGAAKPYSLAWVDEDRIAVLVATADGTAVGVYPIDGAPATAPIDPVGELYPLRAPTADPFLRGTSAPPRYLGTDAAGGVVARPLAPVSWPSFAASGSVQSGRIDSGIVGTVWHRLYLEAAVPPGTSARVKLAASDDRAFVPQASDWFEHRFGDAFDAGDEVPRGVWIDAASEVPFHDGLLACPRRPGVAGLFTALVQRSGRRVRTLAGRYLFVRLELTGDGRATPEIAALRVYAGRRGYAALYLPELYREDVFGRDADLPERATAADFLDRLLGTFEGVITPIEDRIASAWLLSAPSRVPDEAVDWLASWIGFVFAADLPTPRRRRMLERACELYKQRGTLPGLRTALDLATDGAVTRGEIVVVEDFRLRRTFATILGADLDDPNDPLAPGFGASGNSRVGDSLFLGEEDQRAFMALFLPDLPVGTAERIAEDEQAVADLFDSLAHRATVLVHQEIAPEDLGLLGQIVDLEAPAHVDVKIVPASFRFRVAVSSLVGVDTFLAPKPATRPVVVDTSSIGVRDRIERLPSLDPRLGRTS